MHQVIIFLSALSVAAGTQAVDDVFPRNICVTLTRRRRSVCSPTTLTCDDNPNYICSPAAVAYMADVYRINYLKVLQNTWDNRRVHSGAWIKGPKTLPEFIALHGRFFTLKTQPRAFSNWFDARLSMMKMALAVPGFAPMLIQLILPLTAVVGMDEPIPDATQCAKTEAVHVSDLKTLSKASDALLRARDDASFPEPDLAWMLLYVAHLVFDNAYCHTTAWSGPPVNFTVLLQTIVKCIMRTWRTVSLGSLAFLAETSPQVRDYHFQIAAHQLEELDKPRPLVGDAGGYDSPIRGARVASKIQSRKSPVTVADVEDELFAQLSEDNSRFEDEMFAHVIEYT